MLFERGNFDDFTKIKYIIDTGWRDNDILENGYNFVKNERNWTNMIKKLDCMSYYYKKIYIYFYIMSFNFSLNTEIPNKINPGLHENTNRARHDGNSYL